MRMTVGPWLVLCSVVTSPDIKRGVNNLTLANQIRQRLSTLGIVTGGHPSDVASDVLVNTSESRFHLGFTRSETNVSIYLNVSDEMDTLIISDLVSESWNTVYTGRPQQNTGSEALARWGTGTHICPPGRVFEDGTRTATLMFYQGNALSARLASALPAEETYYQVRTIASPNTNALRASTTGLGSITSTAITDSSNAASIGTSQDNTKVPNTDDIIRAAREAGQAVHRGLAEGIAATTGMNTGDIRFGFYAVIGIVGALVMVRIVKEIRKV